LNGAVYLAAVDYWRDAGGFLGAATYAFVMAQTDSVDVDSGLDLELAEVLLARRGAAGRRP
jgi:CMP-N-acetylneuraminic acid synthetase